MKNSRYAIRKQNNQFYSFKENTMQNFNTTSTAASKTVSARLVDSKDRLVVDTKDSVQMGLEIAAGQAALSVIRSFVVPAKMSLVDRFTGKGAMVKKLVDSPVGSFVLAATAHCAVTIFAPNNEKLHKIAKLALNASVVELTARIDIQGYTDKLADKMFNNPTVANLFSNKSDKDA